MEQIMWYVAIGGAALYTLLVLMLLAIFKVGSDADDQMEDYFASKRDEWDGR